MKLPANTQIAPEKLTRYLLIWRKHRDKSRWLAQAGYTLGNWKTLEKDLRKQILSLEAMLTEQTRYGQTYEIADRLTGPNGETIAVRTIWMTETVTDITKSITMFPDKRGK